jgi:hypothetical protein
MSADNFDKRRSGDELLRTFELTARASHVDRSLAGRYDLSFFPVLPHGNYPRAARREEPHIASHGVIAGSTVSSNCSDVVLQATPSASGWGGCNGVERHFLVALGRHASTSASSLVERFKRSP